jgi:serine/threonine protein kinase
MADLVGKQFGNYRLIRLLGQGGFAEVYLADHVHLQTQVAIKVLHTRVEDADVEGFRNEARILARLVHPQIVRVIDFGVEGSIPYLIMDYAPNGTLRKRHPHNSQLPLQTIVQYVKQAAAGLQYAHNEHLIHRDIKPENLLLGCQNEVLLSDFGVALIAQSSRLQSTQDVAGTAVYMAPEQFRGKPRPASDQYSLAIVVYEWLSGKPPFRGSFAEIASQHLLIPPPSLQGIVPLINTEFDQVIMTALAKDPKQRFGSVQAFAHALEQASRLLLDAPCTVHSESNIPTGPASRPDLGNTPAQKTPEPVALTPPPHPKAESVPDSNIAIPLQQPRGIVAANAQPVLVPPQMPNYRVETSPAVQPPPANSLYKPYQPTPSSSYPSRKHSPGISKTTASILVGLAVLILLSSIYLAHSWLSAITGQTSNAPGVTTGRTPSLTTPTSTPGTIIYTASETVAGKSVMALTNDKGWTLYYFTPDTATTSNCTVTCAKTWPPLTSSSRPTSTTTLPGKLSTQTNANGSQVTYNSHPLYTYAKDTAAGQTNGEGAGGKWHVATTDLTVIAGAISTASEVVNGKSVTALTNDKGWTLYYFTPDTATTSNCTGFCATVWPPLTAKETPTSTTTLPGKLGLQTNGNGSQVTYNGHPLYTFAEDASPAQTNGEGVNGKWHVATTDLTWLGESQATPTPSSSGGYNY